MPESILHRKLVKIIYMFVREYVPANYAFLVCADYEDIDRPPATEEGYIPDVYYCHKDMIVIGEAKSFNDYFTTHSKSQMESYVRKGYLYGENALIVVGVPWQLVNQTKNDFRRYIRQYNYSGKIVVIDDNGRESWL